jgi:uncharacterized protein YuzE
MSLAFRHRSPDVRADYDRRADVLYVSAGEPVASEGTGSVNGIELDFAVENGKPCGATVIGLRRNGWADNIAKLSEIIARHISVSERPVSEVIIKAIR